MTRFRSLLTIGLAAALGLPASTASATDGVVRATGKRGIVATVYTADYLVARTSPTSDTRGVLELDDGTVLWVITDVSDPSIYNKGDGSFHPFALEQVANTLGEIDCPGKRVEVEIFILPYPRAGIPVSSASGRRIFLSPQVTTISPVSAAYVISHEMGHVFQWRYLPDLEGDEAADYRVLRGIDDPLRYHAGARHADRPAEIFAEDFRVLFGGADAYAGGNIENTDIAPPEQVTGLEAFYRQLAATPVAAGKERVEIASYPNPFNPSTELKIALDDGLVAEGAPVSVAVYDVTGSLVRTLYEGQATPGAFSVRWDGRDDRGANVASAVYFGVVKAGGIQRSHKLLLVK